MIQKSDHNRRQRESSGVRLALTFVALNLILLPALGQRQTVSFTYPGGVDRVTWDPATISLEQLTRWIRLSPVLSHYNGYLVPENLSLCKAEDPRYKHCGQPQADVPDLENAQTNLNEIASRLDVLRNVDWPEGLSAISHYLEETQGFALQRGMHELAFLQTGDIAALEEKLDTVDPSIACKAQIDQIRSAHDKKEQSKLVRFDWENCIWFAAQKKIGPYPDDAWRNFLAAQGITEVNEEESPD